MRNRIATLMVLVAAACGAKEEPSAPAARTTEATAIPSGSTDAPAPAEATTEQVAQELDIELSTMEEPERHRGGADGSLFIMFPRDNVRESDLDEYRVDITEEFEPGGNLEFRIGKNTIHSEPFDPEEYSTVLPIPADVKSAFAAGKTITWGYYPAKGRATTVKLTLVRDDARLEQKIEKAEQRLADQPPYFAAAMRAQILLNKRLYYAAYRAAKAAASMETEDVSQAYAVMQASLRRMKLHKTPLWAELNERAGGVKGRFGYRAR